MKNYESLNAEQVAEIKSKYGLVESKITNVSVLPEKDHVWDVALLQKDTEVPHSIFTNNIVTHNSFQAEYFMSIARHVGAVPPKMSDSDANQRIFGLQDEKGNWIIKPRVKYYPMNIGEKFFDYMARLMRQLPDKLYKDGKWWLVYEPDNKQHKEHVKKKKPKFSEALWKKTGKWWVETDNGLPQALVVTDSYPAMNPERMDVDDPSAAMAMQARMFADNIKRIKGKMSSKRVTVMGINQLRLRPGVSFGCFQGSTNITLADGSTKTIKNIVDNKLEVDVLSYNPRTKKVESQPVVGWYNNGKAKSEEWLCLKISKDGKSSDLNVTKNHLLMDGRGYLRRANTFLRGETLMHVPDQQMLGADQKQIFLGSVLGGGWFIPGQNDTVGLGIVHAKNQFQYLKWKYDILKPVVAKKYCDGHHHIETVKIGDPWFVDVFSETVCASGLREYQLSPSLISQIEPLGLAVWAMDSSVRSKHLNIPYSRQSASDFINNLNNKFSTDIYYTDATGGYSIFGDENFGNLTLPHIHKTFSREFDRSETGIFTGYKSECDGGFYTKTVTIDAVLENCVKTSDKYDIQVANNHLYVADGIVVENSPEYEPCFIGSTPVHLADGTTDTIKNIVTNRRDVQVLSFDKENGIVSAKNIIDYKSNGFVEAENMICLEFANNHKIVCTKNHKFWTQGGWVDAGRLEAGNALFTYCDGKLIDTYLVSSSSVSDGQFVYDLTVEKNHTYFVGESNNGIAVSNCGEALKFNCFSADTLLQTSKGLMYADELYYATRDKNSTIPQIQGVSNLEQPPIYDYMGDSELVEVNTTDGNFIKGKPGHRVLSINQSFAFALHWTRLDNLSSEYYLPLKIGSDVFNSKSTILECSNKKHELYMLPTSSKELAYLLGYFVVYGSKEHDYVSVRTKSKETLQTFLHYYSKVFGAVENDAKHQYDFEFRLNTDVFLSLLTYVGLEFLPQRQDQLHKVRQVPWIIRVGTKEEQSAFLSVLLQDRKSDKQFFIQSASNKFLVEVQQMLLNFGIFANRFEANPEIVGEISCLELPVGNGADYKNNLFTILPNLIAKLPQSKFKEYLQTKYPSFQDDFSWHSDAKIYAKTLESFEQLQFLDSLQEFMNFVDYTIDNNLVWQKVSTTKIIQKGPTFDANMPETSTIITNGFVSHNSDVRIRMASRSVQGGTGQFEEEPGINGGIDQYRYIHMRAAKNKLSVPNLEGWSRIWVKDAEGQAHGFDPVYDAFHFLKELGLVTGTKNKLKISIPQMEGHKPLSWLKFKKIILGDKKMIRETLESVGVMKPFYLRQELFKMFAQGGKAMELFFAKRKADVDKKGKSDSGDDE